MAKNDLLSLKAKVESLENKNYEYEYGPLNKSKETKLFEEVVQAIIIDKHDKMVSQRDGIIAQNNPKKLSTYIENGKMHIIKDGTDINISELLKM